MGITDQYPGWSGDEHALVAQAQDAIIVRAHSGEICFWNKGAEDVYGWPPAQVLGRVAHELLRAPPSSVEEVNDGLLSHGSWEGELRQVRRDGSPVVVTSRQVLRRDDGQPASVLEINRVVSGADRGPHATRLLEHVHDAIVATDQGLAITAWNPGAQRLYGWRAEEVLGKPVLEILDPELPENTRVEASRVLREGGQWRGEVVHRHKDGRRLQVDAAAVVLSDGPTRVVSVNRDVGEHRRALISEERGRIARELHDSISQALFSMTFQARGLELTLERGHLLSDPVREGIASIRQLTQTALAEMRALILELRPEALEEVGLVVALRRHATALEAREDLTVSFSVPSEPISFEPAVDENLYRLVLEALSNVVRHARASTVDIRLSRLGTASGGVELEITDDGIGFDTDASRPGHLGLTTMAERAARLGGSLEVTSAPGRGTTVRVLLPGVPRAEAR